MLKLIDSTHEGILYCNTQFLQKVMIFASKGEFSDSCLKRFDLVLTAFLISQCYIALNKLFVLIKTHWNKSVFKKQHPPFFSVQLFFSQ